MTPIDRLKAKLTTIADSIRERTGDTDKLTLDQMSEEIDYMPVGDDNETYILVDENGNEIPAVLTEEEVDLTATANDIRLGSIAVTDDGIITGEKEIPSYYVYSGYKLIMKGRQFIFDTENYAYKKLQVIFCPFTKNVASSVNAEKVVIDDVVYNVLSNEPIATVTKDAENTRIDFGLVNESDSICLIRYFMYTEVY